MNEKMRLIRERIRIKRELGQLKGNLNEEPVKEEQKVWCMRCKVKVSVDNPKIKVIESKKGTHRRFLSGSCIKCNHNVCGLIKNQCSRTKRSK